MNIFRLLGDLLHVVSIVLLLLKIRKTQSCQGISLKTQILYVIVFVTRYLDVFITVPSFYNTIMKLIFIGTSIYTVYLMKFQYAKTYDATHDTFRIVFLIAPAAVLALIINHGYRIFELLWTFSIYLEAVAIMPQLFMLVRTKEVETLTVHYILALGGYRGLYLLNWIWRICTESGYRQWIVWIAGLVQTILYADFFYYYYKSVKAGRFNLPMAQH